MHWQYIVAVIYATIIAIMVVQGIAVIVDTKCGTDYERVVYKLLGITWLMNNAKKRRDIKRKCTFLPVGTTVRYRFASGQLAIGTGVIIDCDYSMIAPYRVEFTMPTSGETYAMWCCKDNIVPSYVTYPEEEDG